MDYIETILDSARSKEERNQAVFQLIGKKDKKTLDALIKALLYDRSPVVRHECAFVLGESKITYVAYALMESAINDPEPIVKHEALSALGSLGDPTYIPFIRKYLDDTVTIVRESAEMAIERIERFYGGKCFT